MQHHLSVSADRDHRAVREFSTRDPGEARIRSERFLKCSHEMEVWGRPRDFKAEVRYSAIGDFAVMQARYGAGVTIACDPPIPLITISVVSGGHSVVHREGKSPLIADERNAAVIDYKRSMSMSNQHGVTHHMLVIPRARVTDHLQKLIGRPVREPVEFAGSLDTAGAGRRLVATMGSLSAAAAQLGGERPSAALISEFEHCLLSALLIDHRHTYRDEILRPAPPAPARVVDLVIDYVEAFPDDPLTVADLAAYANVSERALFAAFRRDLGVTPMEYVRSRRLALVRAELLEASASAERTATLTEIAHRHGFSNMGRFASAYRAAYGEFPSETAGRGRAKPLPR